MNPLDIGLVFSWKNGSIQEVIPAPHESKELVIRKMRLLLRQYRPDLSFYDFEVSERDGRYYFFLYEGTSEDTGMED